MHKLDLVQLLADVSFRLVQIVAIVDAMDLIKPCLSSIRTQLDLLTLA